MTLIEVLFSTTILVLVVGGLIASVTVANQLNYASGQRQSAFGLCTDLLEQMRGADYTNVTTTTFAPQQVQLTHLGGSQRVPLMCNRSCTINDLANPTRKEVNILVAWRYRGKTLQETLDAVIYEKK